MLQPIDGIMQPLMLFVFTLTGDDAMCDLSDVVDRIERIEMRISSLKKDVFNCPGGSNNAKLDDLLALAKLGKEKIRLMQNLDVDIEKLQG